MNSKLIIIIFAFVLLAVQPTAVFAAATPSGTATKSAETENSKAKELLDRVATKVAELTNRSRKTYTGVIRSLGKTSLVLTTSEGERPVTTNDVTDFYRFRAGKISEVGFSTLKVGDDLAAIGTIDPANNELTAKQIIVKIKRLNVVGVIESLEKSTLTIKDSAGATTKVDLTDAVSLKKITSEEIQTAKLTDFASGSAVAVIAHTPDPKTGVYSALKALIWTK